jgi:hypothetical protein
MAFSNCDNYDYILEIINKDENTLKNVSNNFKNNYNIVLASVSRWPLTLEFASDELRDNYNIVYRAVTYYPKAFKFASNRLKNNEYIIYKCINYDKLFNFLSDDKKYNYDLIQLYCRKNKYLPLHIFNDNFLKLLKDPYNGTTIESDNPIFTSLGKYTERINNVSKVQSV